MPEAETKPEAEPMARRTWKKPQVRRVILEDIGGTPDSKSGNTEWPASPTGTGYRPES